MARLSRTPVFRGKSRILFSVFRGGKPVTLPESRGKIKLVLKTDLLCDFLDAQRGARQQPAGPDHPLFSQILAWSYSEIFLKAEVECRQTHFELRGNLADTDFLIDALIQTSLYFAAFLDAETGGIGVCDPVQQLKSDS